MLVDAADAGFDFEESTPGQDALLLYGNVSGSNAGLLLSSPDNEFSEAAGGVDLSVVAATETPVTVTVSQTGTALVDAVKDLVDAYNAVRDDLAKLTSFDPDAATTGLLFGSNEALQVDSRLSRVLTDRYFGVGALQSLEQVGLSVTQNGELELDEAKLVAAFEDDPAGVQTFFTDPDLGVATKISATIDRLAGADDSLLAHRTESLTDTIEANQDRIDKMADQLEKQQERLFLQFYQLESIIANMQTSLTAIQNLQPIPPLTSTQSN